jgi:hypothetical protein
MSAVNLRYHSFVSARPEFSRALSALVNRASAIYVSGSLATRSTAEPMGPGPA